MKREFELSPTEQERTMETKHTPGSWYLKGAYGVIAHHPDDYLVTVADCKVLDSTSPHLSLDEAEANARLMAAAPDLLDACLAALPLLVEVNQLFPDGVWGDGNGSVLAALKAAIARATGREG